ncbi:hypothetical protein [Pelomonas cellulosilytica]|uniref:Lipoprotein n=1 Tax=Pelomonas cellulosilytica TaxID=2906762 RepID=A0ABS8XM27_9BURK|nr:hypothetical protein [Pelomonas sp. P8]MCE4553839.1 hypothetical protein [Pelomonas sp. P8]
MKTPCRHAPALLLPAIVLSACGGVAPDFSPVADAMAQGLTCAITNCTESSTLNVDEISPQFTVTQTDDEAQVVVEGSLGKSANLLTTVQPAANESLTASVDGGAEVAMADVSGNRMRYKATLRATSAQPVVRIVFTRAGVRHVSEATMPARFTVLQPTGMAVLTRTSPDLPVRLTLSTMRDTSPAATGSCSRTDNSSFAVDGAALFYASEDSIAGGYRLVASGVDDALNAESRRANKDVATTPLVSRCQLTVAWRHSGASGTVAPTMNQHGFLRPTRVATHALTYDGQR